MNNTSVPVNLLMILDGWGINEDHKGNAVAKAVTPFLDQLVREYPHCKLACSGGAVGLPDGTMGNSEVGHMNIGAGRKVLQDFVRINTAIEDGSFFDNAALKNTMKKVAAANRSLHLVGLLSDGGVHSHISHLSALMEMAKKNRVKNLFIHPILDGRDTPPKSGIQYIRQLEKQIKKTQAGRIATITGRYWAMDRDTRWDRVERAYMLYTQGKGTKETSAETAVENAYKRGQTDEFVEPVIIVDETAPASEPPGIISDGDGVIFFNFRADRAKEITRAFTENQFNGFERLKTPDLADFTCITQYDENFDLPAAFGPQHLDNILGKILSRNHIKQLRIAETEKYAHVTYFFNGGDETVFDLEDRILIPSPRDVATYDEKPVMSAFEVADKACEMIASQQYQFIILNFANMDMVGHTGILDAAVTACEAVDQCVEKVVKKIWETSGTAFVTADHGNAEQMVASDGSPHTAHTLNPVRFILAGDKFKTGPLKNGILGDIAPTILKVLEIPPPEEMTGDSLI